MDANRLYLLDLAAAQLPREVATFPDLGYVRALTATGLIEADLSPSFQLHGRNGEVREAWVLRITSEGMEEIERIKLDIQNQCVLSRSTLREQRSIARLAASGAGLEAQVDGPAKSYASDLNC